MDETERVFQETAEHYEGKMQDMHNEILTLRSQLKKARSKERGYKRTIRKQKKELERLKPDKQHYRNQTGGKKGVRR